MNKLTWSSEFEIEDKTIDSQHKELFSTVSRLWKQIDSPAPDEENLDTLFDQLMDYCKRHFEDEERIMEEAGVDDRHRRLQKMEHASFTYDMGQFRNAGPDDSLRDRLTTLATVASAWLVFHTLRTDQQLGVQLKAIAEGNSPEAAYELALNADFGPKLDRKVIESLICLWGESAERVRELESQLQQHSNCTSDQTVPALRATAA